MLSRSLNFLRLFGSKGRSDLNEQVKLVSADYRIFHVFAIISIGALLATGSSEHGIRLLTFHIDFGLLCGGALGAYSLALALSGRVRLFDSLKNPLAFQIREGFAVISRYLLGTPFPAEIKTRIGRYNILQSFASLALALSFVPLAVGGVAMIFVKRETLLFEEMKVLHLFGVGLMALFFLVHIFAVFHKDNRPLLKAVFTNGRVPLDWAREHVPALLRRQSQEN